MLLTLRVIYADPRAVAFGMAPPLFDRHPARRRLHGQHALRSDGAGLTVTVKVPSTSHEVSVLKVEAWLQSGGRRPNEQAVKVKA
jgi:hypothetical protein